MAYTHHLRAVLTAGVASLTDYSVSALSPGLKMMQFKKCLMFSGQSVLESIYQTRLTTTMRNKNKFQGCISISFFKRNPQRQQSYLKTENIEVRPRCKGGLSLTKCTSRLRRATRGGVYREEKKSKVATSCDNLGKKRFLESLMKSRRQLMWLTKVIRAEAGLESSCPCTGLCTQWVQW